MNKTAYLTIAVLLLTFIAPAISCPKRCKDCEEDRCIRCDEGFSLHRGSCHKCEMEGCTECPFSAREKCSKCKSGYFLKAAPVATDPSRRVCAECTNGCDRCDNENTCIECYALYDLSSDNKCDVDGSIALAAILIGLAALCCLLVCLLALIAAILALIVKLLKKGVKKTKKALYHDSSSSSSESGSHKKKKRNRSHSSHSQKKDYITPHYA